MDRKTQVVHDYDRLPDVNHEVHVDGLAPWHISHPLIEVVWVKSTYDWDWPGVEREFKRTIELNPNYATVYNFPLAHLFLGWAYEQKGVFEETIAEFQTAK